MASKPPSFVPREVVEEFATDLKTYEAAMAYVAIAVLRGRHRAYHEEKPSGNDDR